MHGVGEYEGGVPASVIRRAEEAGNRVLIEECKIVFTRAMSFRRRDRRKPAFVLCAAPDPALSALHRRLGDAMKSSGFRHTRSDFTPHLTLAYDYHPVEERWIEPVYMSVQRLALVQSLHGLGVHVHRARWRAPK